jgi:hypothetical protein
VLWLLLVLFAASGCAALIYEIVWFQLLELVIGSSGVSLGVLLATYMGGLCLGSLGYARTVGRNRRPLRVYAAIEIAIGAASRCWWACRHWIGCMRRMPDMGLPEFSCADYSARFVYWLPPF